MFNLLRGLVNSFNRLPPSQKTKIVQTAVRAVRVVSNEVLNYQRRLREIEIRSAELNKEIARNTANSNNEIGRTNADYKLEVSRNLQRSYASEIKKNELKILLDKENKLISETTKLILDMQNAKLYTRSR